MNSKYVVIFNEKGETWDSMLRKWSLFPKAVSTKILWESELQMAKNSGEKNGFKVDFFFWNEDTDLLIDLNATLSQHGLPTVNFVH